MKEDLARYDRMRKMSGEEPLAKEVLSTIGSLITGSVQKNGRHGVRHVDRQRCDTIRKNQGHVARVAIGTESATHYTSRPANRR